MINHHASAYKLRDRYFIYPSNVTVNGVWIAAPEFVSLSLESSISEIGRAVLSALENSGQIIPHPTVWTGLSKPRLAAAGVRSEKAFHTSAKLVIVYRTIKETQVEPTHNGGSSGPNRGFGAIPSVATYLDNQAPLLVFGHAIMSAFDLCTHET